MYYLTYNLFRYLVGEAVQWGSEADEQPGASGRNRQKARIQTLQGKSAAMFGG